jgi:hypothetical protein
MENLLVARRPWLGLHPRPIPPGKQNNLLPRLSQRQPCTRSVGYEYQERTGRNGKEAAEIAAHSTRDRKEIHSLGDVMSTRRKLAEKYASWSTLLPASIPTCSPPFGYVSVSGASHEATLFTNDASKLGQQLGAEVTKTSAVENKQSASLGEGFRVGLG